MQKSGDKENQMMLTRMDLVGSFEENEIYTLLYKPLYGFQLPSISWRRRPIGVSF